MTKITAKLSNLDVTPRKVRLIIGIIKGKSVGDAEAELTFRKERAAEPILKLLRSAVANAKQKGVNSKDLFIESLQANQGQMLKRWLPRAQGRATPIQKRRSHIVIVLSEKKDKKSRFGYQGGIKEVKEVKEKVSKKPVKEAVKKPKVEEKAAPQAEAKEKPSAIRKVFQRKAI